MVEVDGGAGSSRAAKEPDNSSKKLIGTPNADE